jgi:hypothetical protein
VTRESQRATLNRSKSANALSQNNDICENSSPVLGNTASEPNMHPPHSNRSVDTSTDSSDEELVGRAGPSAPHWSLDIEKLVDVTEEASEMSSGRVQSRAMESANSFDGLSISIAPMTFEPYPQLSRGPTDIDDLESIQSELKQIKTELKQHSELLRSSHGSCDLPDPSSDSAMWNTNAHCVLMWSTLFWPVGRRWSPAAGRFEPLPPRPALHSRSRTQRWVERHLCPLPFLLFAPAFLFIEMCILSAVVDQGFNLKSHIYGDGLYQSPTWRYSGNAYLRVRFVPAGGGGGGGGRASGVTSATDVFNRSMLRDRPADEAEACLAEDYLMPFARYQASATRPFSRRARTHVHVCACARERVCELFSPCSEHTARVHTLCGHLVPSHARLFTHDVNPALD